MTGLNTPWAINRGSVSNSPPLAPSNTIGFMAKYVNDSKLGSGGFGEVYHCIRDTDGEAFAKKILIDESDDSVRRFQREVQILSKLEHPRIVSVTAKHLSKSPFWYTMPLYEHSLRVFVMPVPSPRRVVTMAKDETRHSVANPGVHFMRRQEWGSASAATSTAVVPTDPITAWPRRAQTSLLLVVSTI